MNAFLQEVSDILEIASSGDSGGASAIIVDQAGGLRMIDAHGWSLTALRAEYGAKAIFRVERGGTTVRVEGWNGCDRCLLQRQLPGASAHAMLARLH